MKKQLFPKEIIGSTIEVHQFKHTNKSKIIYSLILLILVVFLISLPFVKVTIYNNSQGLIKPDKERVSISSLTSGDVIQVSLKDNQQVQKGDTLLCINNTVIIQKIRIIESQIADNYTFIDDIELLRFVGKKNVSNKLKTLKYKQEYNLYKQKLDELTTRFRKINTDYKRSQKLFYKGVIAKVEFDNVRFSYDLALNAINQYKKEKQNMWQVEIVNYNNQLKDLESSIIQLKENENLSVIKAPISGTLLNVKGIEKGSYISQGIQLAEISPKSNTIVECYIAPSDIGLLKKGNKVTFQVTAFNYNQWGLANGSIIEIGNDIQMINNAPMFKVFCSLNEQFLQLKNGFKGELKKGMMVNARFELTKRTLFDLLYDKIDDWLNPATLIVAK